VSAQFGGPLRIPKIYSSDRVMVFLSYSASRARNPYNSVSTVPSEAEREGDFSQTTVSGRPVSIYDPLSGATSPAISFRPNASTLPRGDCCSTSRCRPIRRFRCRTIRSSPTRKIAATISALG
jgi:hypothetical protein